MQHHLMDTNGAAETGFYIEKKGFESSETWCF